MERKHLINGREKIVFFGITACLLLIGTFYDYQLSSAVFNENSMISTFLAGYGEYVAYLAIAVAGMFLIIGRNRENKKIGLLQVACGVLLIIVGEGIALWNPTKYTKLTITEIALILLLINVLIIYWVMKIGKTADRKQLVKAAIALSLTVIVEILVINIIKQPWGRPRMRLIVKDSQAYFMPWYQPSIDLKTQLVALGVGKDEFRSFPSGHTANAVLLMQLGLLPRIDNAFEGKRSVLIWIGFIWGIIVAMSRIVLGAHFLSDTAIGLLIGLACLVIVHHFVYCDK